MNVGLGRWSGLTRLWILEVLRKFCFSKLCEFALRFASFMYLPYCRDHLFNGYSYDNQNSKIFKKSSQRTLVFTNLLLKDNT